MRIGFAMALAMMSCCALAACSDAAPPATEAAAAGPAYVGTWGLDPAQCVIDQSAEDAPTIMSVDGYDQHEAHCTFESVTETGPNHWSVSAACSVEGDAQQQSWEMSVDGDTLTLHPNLRLMRCPS